MELNQIALRIFRRHAALIVVFVALGILAALLVHRGEVRQYTATTRLVLDTPDPKSANESLAVADAARAVVTSTAQVRKALATVSAERDPVEIARHDVQLDQLGTSSVLKLSVRDRDPAIAAALSNALASQLIQLRLELHKGSLLRETTQLDARISELQRRIDQIDRSILAAQDSLERNAPGAGAQLAGLNNIRSNLASQKQTLDSERSQLKASDALLPDASVIDPADPPVRADPSRIPHDVALGLLLGLALGCCAAALAESMQPSLVGSEAVAEALDVPLLGTLVCAPGAGDSLAGGRLAGLLTRLQLVASRTHVRSIVLVAVDPAVDSNALGARLELVARVARRQRTLVENPVVAEPAEVVTRGAAEPAAPSAPIGLEVLRTLYQVGEEVGEQVGEQVEGKPGSVNPGKNGAAHLHAVRVFDLAQPAALYGDLDTPGFVLLAPSVLAKSRLRPVADALALTGWPLLGVVTYPPPRKGWLHRRRRHAGGAPAK